MLGSLENFIREFGILGKKGSRGIDDVKEASITGIDFGLEKIMSVRGRVPI